MCVCILVLISHYLLIAHWGDTDCILQWYLGALSLCGYQNNHRNMRSSTEKSISDWNSQPSRNDGEWPRVLADYAKKRFYIMEMQVEEATWPRVGSDGQAECLPPRQAQWCTAWGWKRLALNQVAKEATPLGQHWYSAGSCRCSCLSKTNISGIKEICHL